MQGRAKCFGFGLGGKGDLAGLAAPEAMVKPKTGQAPGAGDQERILGDAVFEDLQGTLPARGYGSGPG